MADFKDKKTVVSEPEVESKVHHDVEVGTADDVAEIMKKYDRESNTRIYGSLCAVRDVDESVCNLGRTVPTTVVPGLRDPVCVRSLPSS